MTNKIKLDKLVHTLGMESELRPLLDSNANGESGYVRFEKAIGEFLDERKNPDDSKNCGWNGWGMPERVSRMMKQYYGIGCDAKCFREVGVLENISGFRVSQLVERAMRAKMLNKYDGRSNRIKKDIWYKTLG